MIEYFQQTTDGIRITVLPYYSRAHSDPAEPRYVFAYRIRIDNLSDATAQLLWRHWDIHDPVAGDSQVEGEGVIGQQPVIAPGESHEYESFCVLRGPTGHMEGFYRLRRTDGTVFRVAVPRFTMRATD